MKSWAVQDAKAHFSELLEVCIADGPQLITKRGTETAVMVPIAEWRRLNEEAKPSLKSLLLSDEFRFNLTLPKRGVAKRRKPQGF